MVTYKVKCKEYILKPLMRAEKNKAISTEGITWNPHKKGYILNFPIPLTEKQKLALEKEGVRFIFP
jgi:hypothetical protein